MKELNISKDYENYSQRNNEIDSANVCGPTNFIQALEYSGWQWDNSMFPQFAQPEDKLTYFCRTNPDVLKYYETHYNNMYKNWRKESEALAKKEGKEYWQVSCEVSYPPNEVHDVMSYAVNLFIGYKPADFTKRPVTRFYDEFIEWEVLWSLKKKLPVVSSVDPFKRGGGHYITIVGVTFKKDVSQIDLNKLTYDEKSVGKYVDLIDEYIIDNTYGKFDFKNKKYLAVSGNDEHIKREKFLEIIKPVSHYFSAGAAACC